MKHHKRRTLFIMFFGVALLYFGSVSRVDATAVIELTETSVAPLFVNDDFAPDLFPIPGVVVFSGSYGSFTQVQATGMTAPILGAVDDPTINLSIQATTIGASTSTQAFTQTGFTSFTSGLIASMGGTLAAGAFVDFYYYLGTDNHIDLDWRNDELIGSFLGVSGSNFSDNFSIYFANLRQPPSSPYALTVVSVLNHTIAGTSGFTSQIVSAPAVAAVPEPTTAVLFGIGLAGLFGGYLVRRKTGRGNSKSDNK